MKLQFKNKPNDSYWVHNPELPNGKMEIWNVRQTCVVSMVLNNYDDSILLVKLPNTNLWSLPCGYLDWDESTLEGALRELHEETNFPVTYMLKELLSNDEYCLRHFNESRIDENQNLGHYIIFKIHSDQFKRNQYLLQSSEEVSDIKWVKISDLIDYEFAYGHNDTISEILHKLTKIELKIVESKYLGLDKTEIYNIER